jgi:hypothetical protein
MTQSAAETRGTPVWVRAMGVVSGVLGGLAWLLVFGILVFFVPKFEEIFARFEIKAGLPWVTKVLISISHVLHVGWPLAACIVFGIPAASILVSIFARSRKGAVAAMVFGLGSLLIPLVALPVIAINLFLPLVVDIKFASGKP